MKMFNIGDVVIMTYYYTKNQIFPDETGVIFEKINNRDYMVRLNNHYNLKGLNREIRADISEIEIDKEYYRNFKINKLLR